MLVRETTHHGNYRNVQEVELPALNPASVLLMVRQCSYVSFANTSTLRAITEDLRTRGQAEHGWVTWEVVSG